MLWPVLSNFPACLSLGSKIHYKRHPDNLELLHSYELGTIDVLEDRLFVRRPIRQSESEYRAEKTDVLAKAIKSRSGTAGSIKAPYEAI